MPAEIKIEVFPAFSELWKPHRYKVYRGGRGSGKSFAVAEFLIVQALQRPYRILCAREFQNSIAESCHRLIQDRIEYHGLASFFTINNTSIKSAAGAEFLFKGLSTGIESVKSTEGINYCWCEEADKISERSWEILIPTIRAPGSEIIVTFNPGDPEDATYVRFVKEHPPDCVSCLVNYPENPLFPEVLRLEMEACRTTDPEKYEHVWMGTCRTMSDAQVFKGKFSVQDFKSPHRTETVFRYGADWGFGSDACALIRCFIKERSLYIDYEAYAHRLELSQLAQLWRSVPGAQQARIFCDCSRPETISYMATPSPANDFAHFNACPADKWSGSIEDGIEFIRQFDKVIIHPRCVNTLYEFRTYAWKIDKNTQQVLPVLVDKNNHLIDALRYALNDIITRRCSILDALR